MYFLWFNGYWCIDGSDRCIVNIYASCPLPEKIEIWNPIKALIEQNEERGISVVGDFNSVRSDVERNGRGERSDTKDMTTFNYFIVQSSLFDIPLAGRIYTYYRPDGTCKSRLDQMLVNQ